MSDYAAARVQHPQTPSILLELLFLSASAALIVIAPDPVDPNLQPWNLTCQLLLGFQRNPSPFSKDLEASVVPT